MFAAAAAAVLLLACGGSSGDDRSATATTTTGDASGGPTDPPGGSGDPGDAEGGDGPFDSCTLLDDAEVVALGGAPLTSPGAAQEAGGRITCLWRISSDDPAAPRLVTALAQPLARFGQMCPADEEAVSVVDIPGVAEGEACSTAGAAQTAETVMLFAPAGDHGVILTFTSGDPTDEVVARLREAMIAALTAVG